MVDRSRPDHPAAEPLSEAAVRRLVDALTGPATPDELAAEEEYVAAFLAVRAPDRDEVGDGGFRRRRRRGRRLRLVVLGGMAALTVTGTAAALTGALDVTPTPEPVRSSAPAAGQSIGSERTAPSASTSGRSASGSATPTSTTPSSAHPAPSGPAASTPTSTPSTVSPPTPTVSGRGHETRTERPSPTPTPHRADQALVNFCLDYARGHLPVGSGGYRALLAAAGSRASIPAYCASIAPRPPHHKS